LLVDLTLEPNIKLLGLISLWMMLFLCRYYNAEFLRMYLLRVGEEYSILMLKKCVFFCFSPIRWEWRGLPQMHIPWRDRDHLHCYRKGQTRIWWYSGDRERPRASLNLLHYFVRISTFRNNWSKWNCFYLFDCELLLTLTIAN
jgi:hypothetical protein